MKAVKNFISNEKNHKALIPVIAVLLGFSLGMLIMVATKENPVDIIKALIRAVFGIDLNRGISDRGFFNPRYVGEYFVYSMPIILTGLSVAFAFRTGLFNFCSYICWIIL